MSAEVLTRSATVFERRADQIAELLRAEIARKLQKEYEERLRLELLRREQELRSEITRVEHLLRAKDAEIIEGLSGDAVSLGAIVQLRAERRELNAYLNGLTFRETSEQPRLDEDHAKEEL